MARPAERRTHAAGPAAGAGRRGPAPLVAPGAYDALSARLIEQAGFDAVYMTGFGTTASLHRPARRRAAVRRARWSTTRAGSSPPSTSR